ncbi:MAG: trigger factor [Bdellovibrionales bacterium]|nr:trigger factor [Bdellovibrionales bacterium]
MKSSVDKLDGLNRKLSISIPVDRIQTAFDTAFRGIQKTAAIKGFRKGKAPIATIKAMYSEKVRADVIDRLVSETYREALQEHELIPLGYPKIDFEELDESKDFTFTAEFEIRPEVKVEKFEGLAVNKEKIAVNESKIDEVLGNIQNSQAELVPVLEDRPAAMGDSADIDFDGFVDGQPLQGGSAKGHVLELGSGQFIEGFEEKLVGMKIGVEAEINLKFPEEYHNSDIAGKPVTFKVKLNGLKKRSLPEIDDELAKKTGEFETLDALKNAIRDDLKANEERRVNEDVRNQLLRELVKENPVEAPESLKAQQKQMILEDVKQKLAQQGLGEKDFEEYKEKWKDDFEDSATFMVQSTFLVDALADQLSLRATAQEVEERMKMYAMQSGIELEKLKEFYKEGDQQSRLAFQITEEKVVATLIEKAKVTEVDAPVEEKLAE